MTALERHPRTRSRAGTAAYRGDPDASPATGPGAKADAVRALLARRADLELQFVQHRHSGTVHVLVPADPGERGREMRFADVPADVALDIALRVRPTVCGYRAREHLGGAGGGDQPVDTFPDDQLCRRCHRALGPHAARAFDHPVPDEHADADATERSVPGPRRVRVLGDLFHGRIPAGATYIGRAAPGLPASPYANPHRIGACRACPQIHDRTGALAAFATDLADRPGLVAAARRDLTGHDLACWCAEGAPCHGDIWLARLASPHPPTD